MTKEEILNLIADEDFNNNWMLKDDIDYFDGHASTIFKVMESFAKQEAIAFKEWQDSSLEEKEWRNYDGHDTWINPNTFQVISTEQLYDLYLRDKNIL